MENMATTENFATMLAAQDKNGSTTAGAIAQLAMKGVDEITQRRQTLFDGMCEESQTPQAQEQNRLEEYFADCFQRAGNLPFFNSMMEAQDFLSGGNSYSVMPRNAPPLTAAQDQNELFYANLAKQLFSGRNTSSAIIAARKAARHASKHRWHGVPAADAGHAKYIERQYKKALAAVKAA